jgi:cytosine/adenosine deaminase-related metal-dependent hydrolase
MILSSLNIIGDGSGKKSIIINNSVIQKICSQKEIRNSNDNIINFENALAFPGLINSHDHLEFNLFPPLGNRTYKNYIEWGTDIHEVNKGLIEQILKIPVQLRFKWGIYKNLFSGVTTVFHHGKIFKDSEKEYIDVFTGGKIFHSVKLEKYWKLRINLPGFNPVVIHIGEGSDKSTKEEIKTLINWNLLKKKIIGIHAIALSKEDAKNLEAVIWCPVSNFFLFNKTADINAFKGETKILFGTDSTVSAAGNIWEHIRFARKLKVFDDKDLFDSLTIIPAEVWNLKSRGEIKENYMADIVIAENKLGNAWDSFFSINSEDIIMILKRGEVIYFDEKIKNQLSFLNNEIKQFYKIIISGHKKYVKGNIGELINSIHKYNPQVQFPFEIEE